MDATSRDGHRQFDFLHGHWAVLNEKLEKGLDDDSTTWFRFDSIVTVTPILGGFGNYDRYSAPEFPGRPGFEAFALRLYDPGRDVWRIWWASTSGGGDLDTPVVGRFSGDRGVFECDDVFEGRHVRMRFDWRIVAEGSARWQQSFSFDDGRNYAPNWVMHWRRASDAQPVTRP